MNTKRILTYAHRVTLELLRDPLSYVFALGFPLVMLGVMTLVNASIPPEAAMDIFTLPALTPAVWIFGLTFLMLFTAQLLAKDRSEAFLIRLYLSPMTSADFLIGYLLPSAFLAIFQGGITFAAGAVIGLFTGEVLSLIGIFRSLVLSVPAILLFLSLGLVFGSVLSDRAAPGISSVVISASSLLGGIWMDVEMMGGVWLKLCRVLPFYHAVRLARAGVSGELDGIPLSLAVVFGYAAVLFVLAAVLFGRQRRK